MPYTLKLSDGLPPLVVCIQGVNDKDTRYTLSAAFSLGKTSFSDTYHFAIHDVEITFEYLRE